MAQEKGKRTATSGILSYSKPLKESLENEMKFLDLKFSVC